MAVSFGGRPGGRLFYSADAGGGNPKIAMVFGADPTSRKEREKWAPGFSYGGNWRKYEDALRKMAGASQRDRRLFGDRVTCRSGRGTGCADAADSAASAESALFFVSGEGGGVDYKR